MIRQCELIHNLKWDILIILDACRPDYFIKLYPRYFKGRYMTVESCGCPTQYWIRNTFPDKYDDIIYLSGNPYIASKKSSLGIVGYWAGEHFHKVDDVWLWGWESIDGIETTPPWNIVESIVRHLKYLNEGYRIIAHFIQPHCILPDNLVITSSEVKTIEDIEPGELVLGKDGRFHKVMAKYRKKYSGYIIRIKVQKLPFEITTTPEHLFLAIKTKRYRGRWVKPYDTWKIDYTPRWVFAGELSKDYFLLIPVIKESKNIRILDIIKDVVVRNNWVYKKYTNPLTKTPRIHPAHKGLPNTLNNDILYLLGCYVAEGSKSAYGSIEISGDTVDVIEKICKKYNLGHYIGYKENKLGKVKRIVIHNILLQKVAETFGDRAENKRLPKWVIELPNDKLKAVLQGLWDGDGSISHLYDKRSNKKYLRHRYFTTSISLAFQVFLSLLKLGHSPYISQTRYHNVAVGSSGVKYEVTYYENSKKHCGYLTDNYLWVGIKDIKREYYEGYVYDLSVEGGAYAVYGIITHNSPYIGRIRINIASPKAARNQVLGEPITVSPPMSYHPLLREAYEANLDLALEYIYRFIVKYDRAYRIVLSSDHGEYLGEDGVYGHTNVNDPFLLKVPWLEIEGVI